MRLSLLRVLRLPRVTHSPGTCGIPPDNVQALRALSAQAGGHVRRMKKACHRRTALHTCFIGLPLPFASRFFFLHFQSLLFSWRSRTIFVALIFLSHTWNEKKGLSSLLHFPPQETTIQTPLPLPLQPPPTSPAAIDEPPLLPTNLSNPPTARSFSITRRCHL